MTFQDTPIAADPTPKRSAQPYYFVKFCQNLQDNENIGAEVARVPGTPLDPPLPCADTLFLPSEMSFILLWLSLSSSWVDYASTHSIPIPYISLAVKDLVVIVKCELYSSLQVLTLWRRLHPSDSSRRPLWHRSLRVWLPHCSHRKLSSYSPANIKEKHIFFLSSQLVSMLRWR